MKNLYYLLLLTICSSNLNAQSYVGDPFAVIDLEWLASPLMYDLDGDGDLDLTTTFDGRDFVYYENVSLDGGIVLEERIDTANPFYDFSFLTSSIPAMGDLDNDGDIDLITGGPSGSLSYHENIGSATNPVYSEGKFYSGILSDLDVEDQTAPAIGDINGDGLMDIITGNDEGEIEYFENIGEIGFPSFEEKTELDNPFNDIVVEGNSRPFVIDINSDGLSDLIIGNSSDTLAIFIATITSVDTLYSPVNNSIYTKEVFLGENSQIFLDDLNNDGLIDLLVGQDEKIQYFFNEGSESQPVFTAFNPFGNIKNFSVFSYINNVSPSAGDFNNDGLMDLLISDIGYTPTFFENEEGKLTKKTGTDSPLNFTSYSSNGAIASADINGDGLEDFVIGGFSGDIKYYVNTGTLTNPEFSISSDNPFSSINVGNYSAPSLIDINNDLLIDIVIGSSDGELVYYKNIGSSTGPSFQKIDDNTNPFLEISFERSVPTFGDIDVDGDYDLLVGNDEGTLVYYENIGDDTSAVFELIDSIDSPFSSFTVGELSKPQFVDVDFDNDLDLIVGNKNGKINIYWDTLSNNKVTSVNLEDNADHLIFSFPNPAQDFMKIYGESGNYSIIKSDGIVAVTGVSVEDESINVSELESGLYFILINDKQLKFIKE